MSETSQPTSSLPTNIFKGLISQPRFLATQTNESIDEESHSEDLRRQILAKLKNNSGNSITTVGQVLDLSITALMYILDPCLTYVECNRLMARIQEACAVQPVTALDVVRRTNLVANDNATRGKLSTGLPSLDAQLNGGFPVCSITEIVGRAGVGKTQLVQQLCVLAATSGDGGAIYIDTENKMSVVRLKEMAVERERGNKRRRVGLNADNQNPSEKVLENVTVHSILTTRELLDTLNQLEKEINQRRLEAEEYKSAVSSGGVRNRGVQRLPVRLLIVDSIAAPLRRDYTSPNAAMLRSAAIFDIARKLKILADNFQLAVVIVNQVGSGNPGGDQRNDTLDVNDGEFSGSLGTVWQYCISTRIALEHDDDPHRLNQGHSQTRRAVITKSLVSKNAQFNFELTLQGIREVSRQRQAC